MQAWLLDQISSIDALHIAEIPDPQPGPGEVLLQMEFAGLNPADRYLAEGQYPARPAFPHILGRDGVGTIAALGHGVDPALHKAGDRRLILRSEVGVNRAGTFAQRVVVPAESLVPPPDGWSPSQCGGAALVYLTAYQALTMWGVLPPGGIVLVTGASGGVGLACVHLARALGQQVIALSRDAVKQKRLLEQGAAHALDPGEPDWQKKLKAMLINRRVDLAIDNIGGTLLPQVIDTLGEDGKVSCVGRLAGPVRSFNTASLFFRRIRLGGVAVSAYTAGESRQAWSEVLAILDRAAVQPMVDSVWPFDQLKEAFARLAAGPMGKVILSIM